MKPMVDDCHQNMRFLFQFWRRISVATRR